MVVQHENGKNGVTKCGQFVFSLNQSVKMMNQPCVR
jgi:hypothetical protein